MTQSIKSECVGSEERSGQMVVEELRVQSKCPENNSLQFSPESGFKVKYHKERKVRAKHKV